MIAADIIDFAVNGLTAEIAEKHVAYFEGNIVKTGVQDASLLIIYSNSKYNVKNTPIYLNYLIFIIYLLN